MAVRISLQIDGSAEFDRTFERFGATFEDLSPIWEEVKQEFWEIEKEQFATEGKAGNSDWKPLSAKYAEQKQKLYPGTKILYRSGKLQKSLTGQTADTVLEINQKSLTIGTSLPYAKYHQKGSGKLPQRKVISFSLRQRDRLQKRVQIKLVKMLKNK